MGFKVNVIATATVALAIVPLILAFAVPARAEATELNCTKYKIYYIDLDTKFIVPPVPIEKNAQKIFCSESGQLDRLFKLIAQTASIKKRSDEAHGRIKIVPTAAPENAAVIHDNGEVVYRMNTYSLRKKPMRLIVDAIKSEAEKAP